MKRLVFAILMGAFVFGANGGRAKQSLSTPAKTNSLAPGFSLTDLSGHKVDLASYRGQVVLLNFWATWCAPCRAEIPEFVDLQNKYGSQGFQILGVSLDDEPDPVSSFYQQFKINYPVAVGDSGLAERYGGILGLPVTFLIACDGTIRARHSGKADRNVIEREIKQLLKAPSCAAK